jgi:cell division protein FtsB
MARKKHNRRRKKATKVVRQIRIEKAIDKLKLKLNMDEEEFNCAQQRAQSRAAILESLQQTYKKVKSISTSYTAASTVVSNQTSASAVVVDDIEGLLNIDGISSSRTKKISTNGSNDSRTILNNIVDAMIASIFDDDSCGTTPPHNNNHLNHRSSTEYMRMKQFYKDAIRGKALILQNTAMQLKASQYKHKHKNIHKRRNILSNTQMKKLHRCDPMQLPPPEFIQEMHQHWWSYAKQVVFNSQSEAQLQARYYYHHHKSLHYTIVIDLSISSTHPSYA